MIVGNKIWAEQIGSVNNEEAYDVKIDSENNLYITGWSIRSLEGASYQTKRFFSFKINQDGGVIWNRMLGSINNTYRTDLGYDLTIDKNNKVYVVGKTMGKFDGNTNLGGDDFFVIKYNPTDKEWSRQFGSQNGEDSLNIVSDENSNLYITGLTGGLILTIKN